MIVCFHAAQEQARRRAPPTEALRGLDTTPEPTDAYSVILVSSTVAATALGEVCACWGFLLVYVRFLTSVRSPILNTGMHSIQTGAGYLQSLW